MAPVVTLVRHPWKAAKGNNPEYPANVCQLAHVGAELRVPSMRKGWMIMVKCDDCGRQYIGDDDLCPDASTQEDIAKAWAAADEFKKSLQAAKARNNAVKSTLDAQKKLAAAARRKADNAVKSAKKAAERAEEAKKEAERKAAEVGSQMFEEKRPASPNGLVDEAVSAGGDREEIDRLRAREHRRLHGLGASAISSASRGERAPVNVQAKLLFWIQPGQPPEECMVTVNTKATVFLEDLPVVAAHCGVETRDFWLWDVVFHKWELATEDEVDVDKQDSTILARVDYPGACQGFGTELHVLQDLMDPKGREDAQLLCDARRIEIGNRHMDVQKVWIVLWWEFGTAPTAVCLKLHNGRWARLSDVQALMSLLGDTPDLDVWVHDQTQWSSQVAWHALTVPAKYDTVLVRKKGLSHMPYLGIEIAALDTRRRLELPTYVPLPQNVPATPARGHAARTFKDLSTPVKTEARESPSKTIKHGSTRVNVVKTEARETPSKTKKARKPRDSAEYINVDELADAPVKVERVTRSKSVGALAASQHTDKTDARFEGVQGPRVEEEADMTPSRNPRAPESGAGSDTQCEPRLERPVVAPADEYEDVLPKADLDSRKRGRDEIAGCGDMSSVLGDRNAKRMKREPSLEGEDMGDNFARASARRGLDWARATVVDANGQECIDIDQLFE
ncbi:hypothetical protein OH76DRAFT_1423735 [Lentinus brumalis]|uniref:Uncharacterized protein n=1 Tax=Lentinus brumalis TaxID=2498619 RepID=A0A371CJD4_9APHY|nr:hypothetical protein OH76DRAFT_1423735 [Polyporus brumalis]